MKKGLVFVAVTVALIVSLSYLVVSQTTGEFTVGNEDPYITNYQVQESDGSWDSTTFDTHDDTTSLRWTVNDPNPDTLTTIICIGTAVDPYNSGACNVVNYQFAGVSRGTQQTYTYDGVTNLGTLDTPTDTINFDSMDCSSQPCTKVYYIDIHVDDGAGGEYILNQQFTLTDYLPTFVDVYAANDLLNVVSCTASLPDPCFISPQQGTYAAVEIKLEVEDLDDDCSALTHSGEAVLCLVDAAGADLCDATNNADYPYTLAYTGIENGNCIFTIDPTVTTGDSRGIEFFIAPGDYKMYLTASSQAGPNAGTWNNQWRYIGLGNYLYGNTVYLGDSVADGGNGIQLGQWNPGLSLAVLTNHGNLPINLDWDATDPSLGGTESCDGHTTTCWDLSTDDDLQVDDDIDLLDDTGNLATVNVPETGVSSAGFQPVGGLDVCDAMTCDSLTLDETLDTYFHIMPPTNLQTGTYNTDFTIAIVTI